jgi:CRISPR/Cas system-associated protein endoribonuclease Cas2
MSVAATAIAQADSNVASYTILDSSAKIVNNLDTLQSNALKITNIRQNDSGTLLAITAKQFSADAFVLAKISGSYFSVSGVSGAKVATVGANKNVTSMTVSDTSANIVKNLTALKSNVEKITSISESDNGKALAITAMQSSADHLVLTKILGSYPLIVTGTKGANALYDTVNSIATFTGGAGNDTFYVTGTDTITDLGNGVDIIKIAAGASVKANLAANWAATVSTSNAASTASSATINSNGHNVSVAVASGTNGWTLNTTGTGTNRLTGSINNDTINGNAAGGLIINGHGGSDTIALGTHKRADTIYLVANAVETITSFGSSGGTIIDGLNVTAMGNALAGMTLHDKTFLATTNSPLPANSSGLVFSYADSGAALTATTAAAMFANTQTLDKFAISKGTGSELLIETGVSSNTNVIWEIIETAGVFTAIKLTGITVVAHHHIAFANLH